MNVVKAFSPPEKSARKAFRSYRRSAAPTSQTVIMADQDQAEIRLEFARLKQEHADFDAAIDAMIAMSCDALQVQRMKKKKLAIKDKLRILEDKVIPNIIA